MDIRTAGSGNVGTLNSFLVSRSWIVGGLVLTVDVLKGALAAFAGAALGEGRTLAAVAGTASIVGHNYPVWLRFHGGRGLATAAGASLVVQWIIVPIWGMLWLPAYAATKTVNPANALACTILLGVSVFLPCSAIAVLTGPADAGMVKWFVILMMGIILTRHIEPVRAFLSRK